MKQHPIIFLALAAGALLASAVAAQPREIELNGFGRFSVTAETRFFIDEDLLPPGSIDSQFGTGFKVTMTTGNQTTNDFGNGNALDIVFENLVRGPVTGRDPLRVLGQAIVVTGDTVLRDLPPGGLDGLFAGDELEVSGFRDGDLGIQATRIRHRDDGFSEWRLRGRVRSLTADHFFIGTQRVGLGPLLDCPDGLADGHSVSVQAMPIAGFMAGDALDTVISIRCAAEALPIPPGAVPAQMEGVISRFVTSADFSIGDQLISATASTVFQRGGRDDLGLGVWIAVRGTLDPKTSILTARVIDFGRAVSFFEGPLNPEAIQPGVSIEALGTSILITPTTRDEDGIAQSGLNTPRQVRIKGYVDGTGTVYAERVRDRGNVDPGEVGLGGPVDQVARPLLQVLGVQLDTSASLFFDADEQPITADEFFAQVSVGAVVKMDDAQYDAETNTLSGGEIELSAPDHTGEGWDKSQFGTGVMGVGIGTVTGLGADLLFDDGFESP